MVSMKLVPPPILGSPMPNATLSAPLTFAPVTAVPACDVDAKP
jgi:hypothetical protein